MSLVVASNRYGGPVALGADTGSWDGLHRLRVPSPKVFRLGRALVGLCGRASVSQVLALPGRLPHPSDGRDPAEFVLLEFAEAFRTACADAPEAQLVQDGAPPYAGVFGLVVLDGHVFDLADGGLCTLLTPEHTGTVARGGPEDFARGAIAYREAWADGDSENGVVVAEVLQAVADVTDTCRGPFDVLTAPS